MSSCSDDEYCSMTVLPYLRDLHYGQRDDEDSDSQEYITEHDLQGMVLNIFCTCLLVIQFLEF